MDAFERPHCTRATGRHRDCRVAEPDAEVLHLDGRVGGLLVIIGKFLGRCKGKGPVTEDAGDVGNAVPGTVRLNVSVVPRQAERLIRHPDDKRGELCLTGQVEDLYAHVLDWSQLANRDLPVRSLYARQLVTPAEGTRRRLMLSACGAKNGLWNNTSEAHGDGYCDGDGCDG